MMLSIFSCAFLPSVFSPLCVGSITGFFVCLFLGPHPWHMEGPRLGVKLELHLPTYATAIAMPNPRHVCHWHHSSWQHWILNPLSEARDQTHNLVVPSRIHFLCATMGTPSLPIFKSRFFFFFDIELYEFSCSFWYSILIRYVIYKYIFPLSRWPFHFVDGFLWCTKAF